MTMQLFLFLTILPAVLGWQLFPFLPPSEPDCSYQSWSSFSKCSCGSLTKYRTRSLIPFAPEECERVESEEVDCSVSACVCQDTRKDCLWKDGKEGGEATGWCDSKNSGNPKEPGTWANWLRRFCAKSCDLCVDDGFGTTTSTTAPPITPSSATETEWTGECVCEEDWTVTQKCPAQSCGLCGREISERKCNSQDKCWTRQEKPCDSSVAQRKKCPRNRLNSLRKLKSGIWPRLRDTGCCGTESAFGTDCQPLGTDPGK